MEPNPIKYDIMKILKSGTITNADYYYDNLVAPPIYSVLYPDDINELHRIATSVKLSGNGTKKIGMIHKIMKHRGFYKLAGGTNRVVYYHPDVPGVVYKVAIDAVGMKDNPAEFRNQDLIKPYCTKVFEVSPCGTVGSFERVERITSFEEFYTIADDVYYLISRILIGKYVLDDIGIDFFMNYGISNRGPVILDFPYVYELDGGKLYCNKILPNGKRCHGEIDYDDGFNHLVCEKCGAIYKARDLGKENDENDKRILVVPKKGALDMKVAVMRGNKVIKEKDFGESGVKNLSKKKNNIRNKVVSEEFDGIHYREIPVVLNVKTKKENPDVEYVNVYSDTEKDIIAIPYRKGEEKDDLLHKIEKIKEIKEEETVTSTPIEEKVEETVTEVSDVVEEPKMETVEQVVEKEEPEQKINEVILDAINEIIDNPERGVPDLEDLVNHYTENQEKPDYMKDHVEEEKSVDSEEDTDMDFHTMYPSLDELVEQYVEESKKTESKEVPIEEYKEETETFEQETPVETIVAEKEETTPKFVEATKEKRSIGELLANY